MSAHTPGPWFISDDVMFIYAPNKPVESNDWCNRFDLRINRGYDESGDKKTTVGECIANARLIAAAPELLEALIAIRDRNHTGDSWALVNAAISKATGGEK